MKKNDCSGLTLRSLCFSYSTSTSSCIHGISLNIVPQEVFVLAGESGSGKTTLLRLIAGFESPTQGSIVFNNKTFYDSQTNIPVEKRNLGYLAQETALFPHLTVIQNVEFGLSYLKARDRRKEALRLLSLVRMEPYADRYPHQISGGQVQRCALVRMLAPKPDILLLDEPFGNLDNQLKHDLLLELRTLLHTLHVTTICVTHDSEEIFLLGDRAAIIKNGRLEQCDTIDTLFSKPRTRYVARYLGKENIFIPRKLSSGNSYSTPFGIIHNMPLSCTAREEYLVRPHHIRLTAINNTTYQKKVAHIQSKDGHDERTDLGRILSIRFAGFYYAIRFESLNPIYRGAHFEVFCTHYDAMLKPGVLIRVRLISKNVLHKIYRY